MNRTGYTEEQIAASVERESAAWLDFGLASAEALQWVYEPDYDPATIEPPREYESTLARFTPAAA